MEQFQLLSEQKSGFPDLVQDAVSMIEAQYAYLYGIDELADLLEVTKHHLIRVFTAAAGTSPGKYLADIRIFHAKNLLLSGEDAPMDIIAGACGYSCGNYFSKVFKKHVGVTPSEYVRCARAEEKTGSSDAAAGSAEAIKKFYL